MKDSARDPDANGVADNSNLSWLEANTTAAESSTNEVNFNANGFWLKTDGSDANTDDATFIYAAWAQYPLKTSRARM